MPANLLKLMFVVSGLAITLLSARSAPLSDTEKAIIAVLLGNKSSFYSVGGTVTYLASGKTLTLQLNGGNNLSVSSNGGFIFSEDVMGGDNYQVTVLTQPPGQTCTALNGSGTAEDDIKNIAVTCDSNTNYAAVIRGRTIDGYIQGATVFLDINGNSTLDGDEPSATSGEGGRFEIGLNEEQAACKALAPVVADVPVGAIDETEGEVTEAYQMALPPGTDAIQSGEEINITPLTSILWAELFALYSSGELPGISCAELENNSTAQEELQRKIDETIANAVRAYNVPEADLLSDYQASGATNAQRTAEDIVKGLQWSLREKIRLEQLYGAGTGVKVVIKRVTGGSQGDEDLGSDEYGWYQEWSLTEENLVRRGIARLSDDLSTELYLVFYKEEYPWTPTTGDIEYRYARSINKPEESSPYQYVCFGQESVRLEEHYADDKGYMSYEIENTTDMGVDSFEECGPEVHGTTLTAQNWLVTEYAFGRADGIYKEQGYYSFDGDQVPLPEMQAIASAPDKLSASDIIGVTTSLAWRFTLPASQTARNESKHLETDGQKLTIEKIAPSSSPELDGNWHRFERFDDGTYLEQWATAPFDTPAQCIDWKTTATAPPGEDVKESCDTLDYHQVQTSFNGPGTVLPLGTFEIADGHSLPITFQPRAGETLQSYTSSCGGELLGSTFVTDPINADCTVSATFSNINGGEEGCWIQRGEDIDVEGMPHYQSNVAMNANGTVVAFGNPEPDSSDSGVVQVFKWENDTWNQLGQSLVGAPSDRLGRSLAISAEGNRLVVSNWKGRVQVYDFNGTAWAQKGQDINSNIDSCHYPGVDISGDGSKILAIMKSDKGIGRGAVRLYTFNSSQIWSKIREATSPQDWVCPSTAKISRDGRFVGVGYFGADVDYEDSGLANLCWSSVMSSSTCGSLDGGWTGSLEGPQTVTVGRGIAMHPNSMRWAVGSYEGFRVGYEPQTHASNSGLITGPAPYRGMTPIAFADSGNMLIAYSHGARKLGAWRRINPGGAVQNWEQVGPWIDVYGGAAASADSTFIATAVKGANGLSGSLRVLQEAECP